MAATADYTINFNVTGPVGSPAVDVKLYIKSNSQGAYTLAYTENNAVPGTPYSYTFNNLDSHTVYQVKIESVCPDSSTLFGDLYYLSNPTCPTISAVPDSGTLDISWDCWIPITGDSVDEYRIEYKDTTSPGPYFIETIPIATVLAYWTANPGTYPTYTHNISTGIVVGQTYEVNMYATLEFDYFLSPPGPASIIADIPVGPCTVTSPPVT